jgi:hypothetical protein
MSFTWPNKDPDELLDYTVDWSRFLTSGRTISTVSWFVDDADGVKQPFIINNTVNGLFNAGIKSIAALQTHRALLLSVSSFL